MPSADSDKGVANTLQYHPYKDDPQHDKATAPYRDNPDLDDDRYRDDPASVKCVLRRRCCFVSGNLHITNYVIPKDGNVYPRK